MQQAPFNAGDAPRAPLLSNRPGPVSRVSQVRILPVRVWIAYAGLAFLAATSPLAAQEPFSLSRSPFALSSESKHAKHKPQEKPAVQPDATIPVTPLGFSPPAPWYLGDRVAQVSLDFLNEDSLLFTFRIPGLVSREPSTTAQDPALRNIRALVLALPSGRVIAQADWRLHDYLPYLWMLKGGKFLLRDRNSVQMGDAELRLTPFLRFPGSVRLLGLDPDQHLLAANSYELLPSPANPTQRQPDLMGSSAGALEPAPSTTSAAVSIADRAPPNPGNNPGNSDAPAPDVQSPPGQNLLRILNMDDRRVLALTRVSSLVRLPLDGQGYYEALRGSGSYWQVVFTYFTGPSAPLVQVESTCNPALEVEAPGILLVSTCSGSSGRRLVVIDRSWPREKARVWDAPMSPTNVWPLVVHAADGPRIARATLEVTHPVTAISPLDSADMRGQIVQVYDLATGKMQLSLPLSPILDAGGNFALSPSGNRLAVLHAGSIEIYNLPPAPPIPAMPPQNPPQPKR